MRCAHCRALDSKTISIQPEKRSQYVVNFPIIWDFFEANVYAKAVPKFSETRSGKGFRRLQALSENFLARRLAIYRHNSKLMNKQITKKQLVKEVMNNMNLSLVQFKTEWSGASQIISPVYEELAKSYKGAVNFFSIDMDEETTAAEEFGVTEIPTILFFKNGRVVDHLVGLAPKNVLIMKIENALAQNN